MNRVLLDTTAYAAFKRNHRGVVARLRLADAIVLTPVVLGELLAGFRLGARLRKNEEELSAFLSSSRVDVVDIDRETAARYALIFERLRAAGTPIPTNDLWIAASAMQYGLSLLTLDAHYVKVGQVLVEYVED